VHTLFGSIKPIKATHSHPDGTIEDFLKIWPAFPLYSDFSPAPYIRVFFHPWTTGQSAIYMIHFLHPSHIICPHSKLTVFYPEMEQQVSLMFICEVSPQSNSVRT